MLLRCHLCTHHLRNGFHLPELQQLISGNLSEELRLLSPWSLTFPWITFSMFLMYPFTEGSLWYLGGDFTNTVGFETPTAPATSLLYWHLWEWGLRHLTLLFLSLINDPTIPISHGCALLDCFLLPLGFINRFCPCSSPSQDKIPTMDT